LKPVKPVDPDHQRLLERNIEEDTRILHVDYRRVQDIPLLIERWSADGVTGSTAVFLTEQVAGMSDSEVQRFLEDRAGVDLAGGVTITRRETHTFVNFGFEAK
jgi:hypothetical protein